LVIESIGKENFLKDYVVYQHGLRTVQGWNDWINEVDASATSNRKKRTKSRGVAMILDPRSNAAHIATSSLPEVDEEGRFLGYQAVNSKVYKVMLNENRLVHAVRGNVSFDFDDAVHPQDDVTNQPEEAHQPHSEFEMGFKSEEALQLESAEEANPTVANEEYEKYMPGLIWTNEQENEFDSRSDDDVESLKSHFSNGGSNGSPEWKTHGASTDVLQDRPRPQYVVNLLMNDEVLDHVKDAKLAAIVKEIGDDHGMVISQLAFNISEKDMGWKKVLNDKLALASYKSLIIPILEDDPKCETILNVGPIVAVNGDSIGDVPSDAVHSLASDKLDMSIAMNTVVDSGDDITADRLKNAAATKKLAIFDAFEILNRIQEEEEMLGDKKVSENKASFKGFAEGRSK
jgi:hypothetical protein